MTPSNTNIVFIFSSFIDLIIYHILELEHQKLFSVCSHIQLHLSSSPHLSILCPGEFDKKKHGKNPG